MPSTLSPSATRARAERKGYLLPAWLRPTRGPTWTIFDQGVVSACNFLTVYLLARAMPAVEFGVYMVVWVCLMFLVSLQSALITQPHNVLGAKRQSLGYRRFTAALVVVQGGGTLLLALTLLGAGSLVSMLGWEAYGRMMAVLGVIALPWMAQEFVRRVLYTKAETFQAFINDSVSYGLQLAAVVALLGIYGTPSIASVLWAFGGSSAVAALLGAWQLRHHVSFRDLTRDSLRTDIGDAVHFGKWLFGTSLLAWFGSNASTWIILVLMGPGPLGIYRAVAHLLSVLNPVRLTAYAYLPARGSAAYAQGGLAGLQHWLQRTLRFTAVPFLVLVLLLSLFAEPILTFAYGDKFAGMRLHYIIAIGAFGELIHFGRSLVEMAIMAMEHSKHLFWRSVVSIFLLVGSSLPLIHAFGILGAPIAGIINAIALLALVAWLYRRLTTGHTSAPALGVA